MIALAASVTERVLTILRRLAKRGTVIKAGASRGSFSLYSQAQKTCDYYYHDHHTDDVKDVHCVLLRVTDAICLWDGKSAIGAHRPRLVMDAKALLEQPCAQGPT